MEATKVRVFGTQGMKVFIVTTLLSYKTKDGYRASLVRVKEVKLHTGSV